MDSKTIWTSAKVDGPILQRLNIFPSSTSALVYRGISSSIDVIILPDSELKKKKQNQIASLLEVLRNTVPHARVFQFSQIFRHQAESVWHSLVEAGDELVNALEETLDYVTTIRPLVFVAYGLGGIVLKRALHTMELKDTSISTKICLAHQGIVFLGVPQLTEHRRDLWSNLNTILEVYGRFNNSYLSSKQEFLPLIADVSMKFCGLGSSSRILTVYESKPTKVRAFPPKKSLLLGAGLAVLNIRDETSFCSPTDFHGISQFPHGHDLCNEISRLIHICASIQIRSQPNSGTIIMTVPNQIDLFGRSGSYWASTESYTESAVGEFTPSRSSDPNAQASGSSESWELVVAEKRIPKMPCYVRKAIDKNRNFVGRSAIIKEIDQALLPNGANLSSGLRSFSLCGFGGLGKTQIATYYAYARESDFDAIFWVQADELMKLNKSFEDIAKALDLVEEGDQGNKAISRDKVLEWFCDPRKRAMRKAASLTDLDSTPAKWLLIFDNADDISILREFWPIGSSGSILITSRDPTAKSDLADQGIDLPPMSSDECAALLQSLVGEAPSATPSHASLSLANRIGNVPLAISQIATRIRRNAMTIEEFLNRHGNNSLLSELNKVQSLPPQEQYRHTLATVWGFENFSAKVQGLINTMVFMDPDNIAEFILQQDSMDKGSISYPKPGDEYDRAWEEFYRTSLVKRKKETKILSLHREIQEVAKSRMTDDQQQKYYEHTIDILSRAWTYSDEPFTRENFKQSACDDVLPHIQSIFRVYESPLTNFVISTPSAKKLVKLLQEAGWYLVQSAQYDPVLPMFNLAMSISQSHGDIMKDLLADTAFSLARYGEETNMDPHKVFEYCDLYHRLSKELNDGSTARVQNLATSHTSLAQAYLLLDRYEKAAEHCIKCIAIEDDYPDHKSGAWMSQFAHIYLAWAEHGMGNYAKAIALTSKVIEFRMRTFGPDDTESIKLGLALHCFANACQNLGLHRDSQEAYRKALANFRACLGPNSFRVGQMKLKLAEQLGNHKGFGQLAESFFNEAIKIFSATSYYSPELARALYKRYQFSVSLNTGSPNDTTPVLENLIYKEAAETYHRLCPQADKTTLLNALDFDSFVRFWSR
ncbi:hypothetical protein V8C40DRAFT_243423 [Trichoderma camerunense]